MAFAVTMIVVGARHNRHPPWVFATAEAIGLSFLAAGVAAWWRRPDSRVGGLMVASGALWYVSDLQATGRPPLVALGYWLAYLPLVVIGHLALLYPDGRLRRPLERWTVAAAYASYLTLQGIRYLLEGSSGPIGWQAPAVSSSLLADVLSADAFLFTAVLSLWIAQRWLAASRPARRVHAPVWLSILFLNLAVVTATAASVLDLAPAVLTALELLYGLCLAALPFAFLSGLLRVRLARRRVADLVVALQDPPDPARLRALLAETLGDPSLVLGFWSREAAGYVDVDGGRVRLPPAGSARAVTFVEPPATQAAQATRAWHLPRHRRGMRSGAQARRRGWPMAAAVLLHDPALSEQQALVRAVVAAARLAIANARLEAVLHAQTAELRASRTRLVEAALTERRNIERDLHDGLQHRLLRLSWLAERAGALAAANGQARDALAPLLDELACQARDTHVELRELARGIHPAILTAKGLAIAVEEHALRAPVPVLVDLPDRRWAAPVEATVFFAIVEALTNAIKHASADRITVRGHQDAGRLTVEIADNGVGGADPRRGSGLAGLRGRVTALGGTLTVHSPPEQGTRVVMELPCE